jgi:hypothetical protein
VADASDGEVVFRGMLEEDAVISAAEPKSCHGRLELLDIAVARGELAVDAMKDIECGLPGSPAIAGYPILRFLLAQLGMNNPLPPKPLNSHLRPCQNGNPPQKYPIDHRTKPPQKPSKTPANSHVKPFPS